VALEAPAFVGRLITMTGFRSSAPKAENGFVHRRNCFVAGVPTKQFPLRASDFKWLALSFSGRILLRQKAGPTPMTARRRPSEQVFYFYLLESRLGGACAGEPRPHD
jgi:hypothetical protein